jgi:hypothetical protein
MKTSLRHDGDLMGLRYDNWKLALAIQPAPGTLAIWQMENRGGVDCEARKQPHAQTIAWAAQILPSKRFYRTKQHGHLAAAQDRLARVTTL